MTTIPLDYDNRSLGFVAIDAAQLMRAAEPGDSLEIRESSPDHYHILYQTARELAFKESMSIALTTNCSKDYLIRVGKVGYFCIRTSKKSDGTPEPKVIIRMTREGKENLKP